MRAVPCRHCFRITRLQEHSADASDLFHLGGLFDAFLRRGSSGPKATGGQEQGPDSNKSFSLHGDCYTADRGEVLLIGICFLPCPVLYAARERENWFLGLTKYEGTLLS